MSCNLTPKISVLLDGESTPEETRKLEAHLQTCSACQSARADFQLLSQQIASYSCPPNWIAQQQTLAEIFRAAESPAPSPRTVAARSPHRRFKFPARVKAFNGALALLCLCLAAIAGLYFLTRKTDPARPIAQTPAASGELFVERDTERPTVARVRQAQPQAVASEVNNVRRPRATKNLVIRQREQRRAISESIEDGLVTSDLADSSAVAAAESAISPGRHVEQAITLLSSFRNARPREAKRGFDLAHEKRKSQKLIYQNVVLRREAANEGDVQTESLLQNLEPILIDIAHLPEKPARHEVLSIKDRMQRKSIVAMLRASQSGHTQQF